MKSKVLLLLVMTVASQSNTNWRSNFYKTFSNLGQKISQGWQATYSNPAITGVLGATTGGFIAWKMAQFSCENKLTKLKEFLDTEKNTLTTIKKSLSAESAKFAEIRESFSAESANLSKESARLNKERDLLATENARLITESAKLAAESELLAKVKNSLNANIKDLNAKEEWLTTKRKLFTDERNSFADVRRALNGDIKKFDAKKELLAAEIKKFAKEKEQFDKERKEFIKERKTLATQNALLWAIYNTNQEAVGAAELLSRIASKYFADLNEKELSLLPHPDLFKINDTHPYSVKYHEHFKISIKESANRERITDSRL